MIWRLTILSFLGILFISTASASAQPAPVTIQEDATTYILDNGIIQATVAKQSGDLISMKYNGLEMLATIMGPDGKPDLAADPPGANGRGFGPFTDHQYGFWSHDAMGPSGSDNDPAHPLTIARITIDPLSNSGERGEVSVKGISNGRKMGTGPGSNAQGNFISDIEIRYCLGRGDSGVYTYCMFEHQPEYPASTITEARFCFKLNDFFDWMLVSPQHNKLYPKDARENKYDYTTDQFEHPAYGWASTSKNIGCFLVNPSMEYMSGGPTKVEFLCHRDTNAVSAPCILNYWRSSHYGGAGVSVAAGEHWAKVIGPFLLYCNSGGDPQTLWKDAIDQAGRESAKWPFDWVKGVDYPDKTQRAAVTGQIVLSDPYYSGVMSHVRVGLTHEDYSVAGLGGPRTVDWQQDAKYYEFWVNATDIGNFSIPNVRAGHYTLHAIADGVLGEFVQKDVLVVPGFDVDLRQMVWQPVRYGRQIWEIGIPNRNGSEFLKGDDYFHDGMAILYAQLFPNDVNFVVGQSDYRKDWYFEQVPHADAATIAAAARARPTVVITAPPTQPTARGGRGRGPAPSGRATPWSITFDMPDGQVLGKATLRVAISATGTNQIAVSVNGKSAGTIGQLRPDATFGMGNGIQGLWYERALAFDGALLKPGRNVMTLTIPPGPLTAGVVYDYLRLELDDSGQ